MVGRVTTRRGVTCASVAGLAARDSVDRAHGATLTDEILNLVEGLSEVSLANTAVTSTI